MNFVSLYFFIVLGSLGICSQSLGQTEFDSMTLKVVDNARKMHTLEIEAYTRRGVHPAYALAAILRDEGGEDNARLAGAILETGIGFGGINPARAANPLETAIACLTAFSLGVNYRGALFESRAEGKTTPHQTVLRHFFERGKNVFPPEKDIPATFFEDTEDDKLFGAKDTDTEKYEHFREDGKLFVKKREIDPKTGKELSTQIYELKIEGELQADIDFLDSLKTDDPLLISSETFLESFAAGLNGRYYLNGLISPEVYIPQKMFLDNSDDEIIQSWLEGEVWSEEYIPNLLRASLRAFDRPEFPSLLKRKARRNLLLGFLYISRAPMAQKYPDLESAYRKWKREQGGDIAFTRNVMEALNELGLGS